LHATPLKDKKCELYTTQDGLEIGSAEMQGWRLEMEDAHITMSMTSKPDHTFVAVFDGHGGSTSAVYAAANMMNIIEDNSFWKQYINGGASDVDLLGRALSLAFFDTDAALRTEIYSDGRNVSGCTCVSAIITPSHIVCGNAGDSRCVIGTNKMTKGMSKDHKPTDELEQTRIYRAGGKVHAGRVDGDLAVSRAFGDFRFKNRLDLAPNQQKV
jgi:serine/threonine protein phosphatase PrpC